MNKRNLLTMQEFYNIINFASRMEAPKDVEICLGRGVAQLG